MKFNYFNIFVGLFFLVGGLSSIGDELHYKYGGPKLPDETPYIFVAYGAAWLVFEFFSARKRKVKEDKKLHDV